LQSVASRQQGCCGRAARSSVSGSQEQIALVISCPAQKVKALVFQARTHLLAEREARDTECTEIRQQLEAARGGELRRELRRGLLRRHLRRCEPCKTYSVAVAAQRKELAGLLGVVPSAELKLAVAGRPALRPRARGQRAPRPGPTALSTAPGTRHQPATRRRPHNQPPHGRAPRGAR
jgi:hypothetical protein